MKNWELIEKLQKLPLDAEVEFDVEMPDSDYRDTYSRVGTVEYVDVLGGIVNIELDIGI